MSVDLRHVRYFIEIAEQGSFSRAARSLGVAQPALSRQLKALEETLGALLFHRNGRGIALTAAGEIFFSHARSVIEHLSLAQREIASLQGVPRGVVKLGLPPSVCATILRPLVTMVAERHPQISLRIEEAISTNLAEWLETAKLDLAVVYLHRGKPGFDSEALLTEELLLVHHPDLQVAGPVTPQELARVPLALPTAPSALRQLIETGLAGHDLKPNIRFAIDSVLVLKGLAMDGTASTILPYAAVQAEVGAGMLQVTPIVAPVLTRTMALLLPNGRPLDLAARAVLRAIRDVATALRVAQMPPAAERPRPPALVQ